MDWKPLDSLTIRVGLREDAKDYVEHGNLGTLPFGTSSLDGGTALIARCGKCKELLWFVDKYTNIEMTFDNNSSIFMLFVFCLLLLHR